MRRSTALLALVAYGAALAALRPTAGQWPQGDLLEWIRTDPQWAMAWLCWATGWLTAAWFFLVGALSLGATARGRAGRFADSWSRRLTPLAVRRLLQAALGVTLAVGPAGAAIAAPTGTSGTGRAAISSSQTQAPALAAVPPPILAPEVPIPDLDWPSAAASAPERPSSVASAPKAQPIPVSHRVVRPGDTLWGLAAASLDASATPLEITRAWERWYATNRASIGNDPSFLLPGEHLTAPGSLA